MAHASLRHLFAGVAILLCASPAFAGGGAHAVDDAAVETPGDCHLENWITDYGHDASLLNFGPACTLESLPTVEWGATIQRVRDSGQTAWLVGPALKWSIHTSRDGNVALALAGAMTADTRSGNIDAASLIVPISFRLSNRLAMNVNLGWGYARGQGHDALYGVQFDYAVRDGLALMAEIHGPLSDHPGAQGGVRWIIDQGRIDLDLLAARSPGYGSNAALTLGVTIRR